MSISATLEDKNGVTYAAKFGIARFAHSKFGQGTSLPSLTLESKIAGATWADETNTWANTPGTWQSQGAIASLESKNSGSLTLETKN